MKLHHFFLHFGQHEDLSLAHLNVRHKAGFNNVLAAMLDFRRVLAEHLQRRTSRHIRDCCNQNAGHNFCSTCGTDLRARDPEDEADLVAQLYLSLFWEPGTMDGCAKLMRRFEAEGWELSYRGVPVDPVVVTNVDRWLEGWWGECEMPYMEAEFPDGTTWSTYDDR
jgi:hypothetical protein